MNLYTDCPFRIQGYATVFNQDAATDPPIRFLPGCFMLAGQQISMLFEHDWNMLQASTGDKNLRLWQDEYGLAFEMDVPGTWSAMSLLQGIRAGDFRECSVGLDFSRPAHFDASSEVATFRLAHVAEISVADSGAMPGTGVWVDDEGGELPAHLAMLRNRWRAGRRQAGAAAARRSAPRIAARAARRPVVPESASKVLAEVSTVSRRWR